MLIFFPLFGPMPALDKVETLLQKDSTEKPPSTAKYP